MKALLRRLLSKLWPAKAPAHPAAPGHRPLPVGGGWALEVFHLAGGELQRRLVCPSRRRSWPQERRGHFTALGRIALPN